MPRRRAVTRIEVLVVLHILALVGAMLAAAVARIREAADSIITPRRK